MLSWILTLLFLFIGFTAMRPWPLKIAGYNPLSASVAERREDIVAELSNFDVICLNGTGIPKGRFNIIGDAQQIGDFRALHTGWQKSSMSNKSCGASIFWGKRFKKAKMHPTLELSGLPQGRAIASRAQGKYYDLTVISAYFPPVPNSAAELATYRQCCELIVSWITKVIKDTPNASTPILFSDVNDGIGKQLISSLAGREVLEIETKVVHPRAKRVEKVEGGAGSLIRPMLEHFEMVSMSSWLDDRDTYFGNHSSSLIDHIFAPAALATGIRSSGPLMRASRRLQLIKQKGAC